MRWIRDLRAAGYMFFTEARDRTKTHRDWQEQGRRVPIDLAVNLVEKRDICRKYIYSSPVKDVTNWLGFCTINTCQIYLLD